MNVDYLAVENFASYGREELDFRQLGRTVSVFGSTGAGKTTFFIDALTLALYGRAYGQQDRESARWTLSPSGGFAIVSLVFTIDDRRYRVDRRILKIRAGEAKLSQIISPEKTKPVAVGVREVERKLNEILGFDHQTFLNTVVVRQGDVSALINQDPKGRREVFLRAFDVDYTRHKEKAHNLRDEARATLDRLQTLRSTLEETVGKKDLVNSQLTQVLATIEAEEQEKVQLLRRLQSGQKELESTRAEMTSTQVELSRFEEKEKQLKQLRGEQGEKEKSLTEIERLVADKPSVLKDREKVSVSQEAYRKAAEAVSQINSLKALLEQSRKQKDGLVKKTSKKERVEADLKTVREKEQKVPSFRTGLAEKDSEYERLTREIERLRGSMGTVRRSLAALESAGDEAAACPVCGTALSKDRLHETKQHLESEVKVLGAMVKQLEPQSRKIGEERRTVEEEVRECEKAAARKEGLEEELREVGEAETQLAQVEEEIGKLSEQREAYGEQCVRLVRHLPSKEQVEEKLLELKKRDEALRADLDRVTKGEAQMETIGKRLEELKEQTSILAKELLQAKPLKAKAEKLGKRVGELEESVEQLQGSLRQLEGRLGEARATEKSLREDLEEIRAKEEELAKTREAIGGQTKSLQAYELLYGEVFHEKGFPLTLLRDFLQDVELFAQGYISRFLPDKSIRIEADEDGRVAIDVIDGAAVRELATYSGGETVLIGFAVRLGIARAIAERSVANAPSFLIIDEGFGPLSPEFRSEVLRTLNELSQDYERIMVISHVDDVRESPFFTSQIHISKDNDGHSHIEILKQ